MPMPDYPNYGMNYGMNYGVNTGMNCGMDMGTIMGMNYGAQMASDCMVNLCPATGGFVPKAYFIDQPYIGLLPYAQGLEKGTIFPNLLLPVNDLA